MRFGGILRIYSGKEVFMFRAIFVMMEVLVMRAVNRMQLEA
jgi:hypothetical protein